MTEQRELVQAKGAAMTLPKNFIASVCLAVALAGVAVITAAVGQTHPSGAASLHQLSPHQGGGRSGP
jgi:hypothetical protein